jgi:hypothetical protein
MDSAMTTSNVSTDSVFTEIPDVNLSAVRTVTAGDPRFAATESAVVRRGTVRAEDRVIPDVHRMPTVEAVKFVPTEPVDAPLLRAADLEEEAMAAEEEAVAVAVVAAEWRSKRPWHLMVRSPWNQRVDGHSKPPRSRCPRS